jgi:HEAT repeat protein
LNIAQAIRHIGPYGKKEVLLKLLGDKVIARAAAIVLAQMGVKEVVPKIIELLLNDNIWPSDFAQALNMLADESIIPQLIEYGKQVEEDSLTDSNLAEILSNLESEELYSEISKLVQSEIAKERQFAVEILEKIDSDRAREFLVQKLSDSDYNVRWRVIFGLSGRFNRKPCKSEAITAQMFDLLTDKESGHSAAEYLRDIADDTVIKEATSRLQFPRNEYEQINLCAIIAKYDPETSKRMLFDTLENYNPSFHETLYAALASLDKKYILPDIFAYLKTNNKDLRLTVLETLRWALPHKEQIVIDKESCENLITLWETTDEDMEKHIIKFLLTDQFSTMSRDMLLKRFCDVTYPFREELIEFVDRLSLVKGDLSLDVIEWLITKLHYKNEKYQMLSWNPSASILGSVCDEGILKEKLIPLLNSNNEVLRSNAYIAVSKAERVLGKRFIKK